MKAASFQWYVAWRYLLARPRRISGWLLAVFVAFTCLLLGLVAAVPIRMYGIPYLSPGPTWQPALVLATGLFLILPFVALLGALLRRRLYLLSPSGLIRYAAWATLTGWWTYGIARYMELEGRPPPALYLITVLAGSLQPIWRFMWRWFPRSVQALFRYFLPSAGMVALIAGACYGVYEGVIAFDHALLTWSARAIWIEFAPWVGGALVVGILALVLCRARGVDLVAGLITVLLSAGYVGMWRMLQHVADVELLNYDSPIQIPMWIVFPLIGVIIFFAQSLLLLIIRYFFTFSTTVSIGGVDIGGMALVLVLSVMGGFENHLRSRILGSDAHILVTRKDDAPFVEYREIESRIAKVAGVRAHSPFVQSEVVIAANSNYGSAIIKGVDPSTVGQVSDLGKNCEDPQALDKLWPLSPDGKVIGRPPVRPRAAAPVKADAPDHAPDNMDLPDDAPVDFSLRATPKVLPGGTLLVPDPAPSNMDLPTHDAPIDFSGTSGPPAPPKPGEIHELIVPMDPGDRILPEVAVLPGVLVGRELVKHVTLYAGNEAKLLSPLGQDTPVGQVPRTMRIRVAGEFFTGMYKNDLKYIYVELGTLQDFLDLGDQVNGIEIRIDQPDGTAPIMAALKKELGSNYDVKDWKEINRSLFSALKLEKIAMFLVLVICILVASFSIMGNLIMTVYEKGREIAILKTLGASPRGILKIFVIQGFFIGLIGTLSGVGLGLLFCWLNVRVGVPIDPEVYYMDRLPTHVEPYAMIPIAAAGVVISVLATIYPAYVAARMEVVRGLRQE